MGPDEYLSTCVVVEARGQWGVAVGRMQGQALLTLFHHTTPDDAIASTEGSAFVLLNDGDLVRLIVALQEQLSGPHPGHRHPAAEGA